MQLSPLLQRQPRPRSSRLTLDREPLAPERPAAAIPARPQVHPSIPATPTLAPAAPQPGAANRLPSPAPRAAAPDRPRLRPMARFSEEEESPSFYLSLSDLMCLLLVCFVLIFSLTDPGARLDPAPRVEGDQAPPQGVYRAAMPSLRLTAGDPLPIPEVTPPGTRMGLVAVASAGQGDPGLAAQPRAAEPGAGAQSRGLFLDRSLLSLVTASELVPPEFRPQEEPSLASLVSQVQSQMAAAGSAAQGLEIDRQPDRLVLRLPESITFDLGRAEIKPAMLRTLGGLAAVLAQRRDMAVVVSGHTDDLPINTPQYASNWELSAARAAAVARALIAQGQDESRLTIRGLADQQPRVPNHDAMARQQNRRVEIELRPLG